MSYMPEVNDLFKNKLWFKYSFDKVSGLHCAGKLYNLYKLVLRIAQPDFLDRDSITSFRNRIYRCAVNRFLEQLTDPMVNHYSNVTWFLHMIVVQLEQRFLENKKCYPSNLFLNVVVDIPRYTLRKFKEKKNIFWVMNFLKKMIKKRWCCHLDCAKFTY